MTLKNTCETELAFRYFIFKVIVVAKEEAAKKGREVFITKRKVMLWLFFACVLNKSLLGIFGRWYALPKGPMEDTCFGVFKKFPNIIEEAIEQANKYRTCKECGCTTLRKQNVKKERDKINTLQD